MASPKRREQKNKEKEMSFFSVKASFVAGVVLIITIFKDIAELFLTIPPLIVGCYLAFCLLMAFFVLGTHVFDKKFKSKAVSNFGNFLTVGSVIVFIIENSVIKYADANSRIDAIIATTLIGATLIASAAYLLFRKNKAHKN